MKTLKYLLFLIGLMMSTVIFGQRLNEIKNYNHYSIHLENDTINYHTYANGNKDSLNSVLFYAQGSEASSLYRIKKENKKVYIYTTIPFSLKSIPQNCLLVVISKKGFQFSTQIEGAFQTPNSYFKNQTLDYRVFQANTVIEDVIRKHSFDKIIALGHSEGSDVIAKLGTVNKEITHFGYFSGGGLSQFSDFVLSIRNEVNKGLISETIAQIKIDSLLNQFKDIIEQPDAIDKSWLGEQNTYKRWSHFSEPPINNLLKINSPIFVAIGTNDKKVPIESAYHIPVEFIRLNKTNLTFKPYINLNHSFREALGNGKTVNKWDDIFKEFLDWTKIN